MLILEHSCVNTGNYTDSLWLIKIWKVCI